METKSPPPVEVEVPSELAVLPWNRVRLARGVSAVTGILAVALVLSRFLVFGADRTVGIHEAAARGDAERIEELLAESHDLLNSRNEDDYTPLHLAAQRGNLEAVLVLLHHGADLYPRTRKGYEPLQEAAVNGRTDVVHALVAFGARPDLRPLEHLWRWDYVMKEIEGKYPEIVEVLRENRIPDDA